MSISLTWIKSTGVAQADGASLASSGGGTYYAEIPVDLASGFGVGVICDATAVATVTIEGCMAGTPSPYAAVGTGWVALPALGSCAPAASASSFAFEVSGASCTRYRVKCVVGTAGVITGSYQVKGG